MGVGHDRREPMGAAVVGVAAAAEDHTVDRDREGYLWRFGKEEALD